jgi:hypothetical protein
MFTNTGLLFLLKATVLTNDFHRLSGEKNTQYNIGVTAGGDLRKEFN